MRDNLTVLVSTNSSSSDTALWSTLAVAAASFAIPFLGGASALFGLVRLSAPGLAALVAIVGGCILVTEIARAWFFRHENASLRTMPAEPGRQA